eukprot:UN01009
MQILLIVILISIINMVHSTYVCMYAKSNGKRCGYCDPTYCSTEYASYACEFYMFQEESVYTESESQCNDYIDAATGYSSTDMISCAKGVPKLVHSLVKKACKWKGETPPQNAVVTFGDVQEVLDGWIYEKGRDAVEEAICVASLEELAAALCEGPVYTVVMSYINQYIIDPYVQATVTNVLKDSEDAIIDEIADSAAIKSQEILYVTLYQESATYNQCTSGAINLSLSRCLFYVVLLACMFIF